MAGIIPQSFIDLIRDRTDIVDVVGARVQLKRSGSNWVGLCPFHTEKTPSFSVSQAKQFYHCFGCGVSGNAITFLMEAEGHTFVEAIEALAARIGLTVPYEGSAERPPTGAQQPVYQTLEAAAGCYARWLREHATAGRAATYLKGRGVSGQIAKTFALGYAPPGRSNLVAVMNTELALAAGLAATNERNEVYDRFRDRVMFPIRDRRGRVIGFGGRVLDPTGQPKYLNSPETPVFHKRREVYGLFELLQRQPKPARIIVVEGYLDVIALFQHGIECVVATLGTAVCAEQLELLFRYTNELVVCFDGDAAGRAAAWRAVEAALPTLRDGRRMRFLELPDGHDPDSLVRAEGAAPFEQRLANGLPYSEYFFVRLLHENPLDSIESRAKLHRIARPWLNQLPDGLFKQLMLRRLNDLIWPRGRATPASTVAKKPPRPPLAAADRAVQLLLQNPAIASRLEEEQLLQLAACGQDGAFLAVLARHLAAADATVERVLNSYRGHSEEAYLQEMLAQERLLTEEQAFHEFTDYLVRRTGSHITGSFTH